MIVQSIRDAIPPIHREGRPFIIAALVAAVLLGFPFEPAFWILAILAAWMTLFFRDPVRTVPVAEGLVVSPADGRVEPIVAVPPPVELGLGSEPLLRISVFMNVFDCHINRAPVGGTIRRIVYRPGKFLNADLDKASDDNERNGLVIEDGAGRSVGVVQIAGLVARRILCWPKEGDTIAAGERIGMIRFGSRLDTYLPAGSVAVVHAGQRAVAGETILAHLPGPMPAPPFEARRE